MKHFSTYLVRCSGVIALAISLWACSSVNAGWQLVWSDEFSQPDGSSPDSTKWGYDTGGTGWGNNELEYYTSRTNNARIQNGQLVIEAKQESFGGKNYTSARMLTKGKWSWTYGRIEANIKIPRGQGIWPAFWMLGTNIDSAGWPSCGEIDIMENIGKTNNNEQGKIYGTIHGPQGGGDYNGGAGVGGTYTLPSGAYADNFHVYAIEWTTNQMKWYMDNVQYFTATPASLPGGSSWPFTAPEFILLNVAVGGNWPGYPSNYTVFPQQMLVDYVRVYTFVAGPPNAPTGLTAGAGNGKAFLNWDASNSGATGYNVKRSTNSGGPYATIASPVSNSYTDTVGSCASYYYVVSATNSLGESTNSSEAAARLGAFYFAVNSGGTTAGSFVADTNVSGGTVAAPFTATADTTGVVNPAPQAVYQTERYGTFSYTFGGLTPGLSYKVRLHFAEMYWSAVGQRKFNVFINGTQVLTNFDIIAVAGAANKVIIPEFNAMPVSGQITIQYTAVVDQAKSNGIELLIPLPSTPTNLVATGGNAQVTLRWNAATDAATYNVKRALTNTGPYTQIATALTGTNFTDSPLTNGTTYYYVVSSVNAGCESGNSSSANATPVCSPPTAPVAANNSPIYPGTTLLLSASTVGGATYQWSGPNSFSSTDQNPSIENANTNAAGTYSVTATVGGCVSTAATTTVTINPSVTATISNGPEGITITWPTGTLQYATDVVGPWFDLTGTNSPYSTPATELQQFFRVRVQ